MSVGDLNTQGNQGKNFPFQLAVLQLLGAINSGISALPGVDYETRTTMFQAIAAGPGYSIGDIIIRYDIIDVATSTIVSTIWFNQTTQSTIAAPAPADITPIAGASSVTVINGPLGAAINIQDGGNSITIDALNLDVALSTRASEVTALAINANLTGAARTYTTISTSGAGTVPAGSRVGSMLNVGSASGIWNGASIPAGVGIPFDAGGRLDTLPAIAFDATGTTFIIEYTL